MSDAQKAKLRAALTKPVPTSKRCPRCTETKPSDQFGLRPNGRWLKSHCKPCAAILAKQKRRLTPEAQSAANRRAKLKRYGITEDEYEQMSQAQSGACAICKQIPIKRPLFVDHDHRTGQARGLLCDLCNAGIGMLGDSVDRMLVAIEYLNAYS